MPSWRKGRMPTRTWRGPRPVRGGTEGREKME